MRRRRGVPRTTWTGLATHAFHTTRRYPSGFGSGRVTLASLSRSGVRQCGSPLASRFLPLALVGPRRHEHGTQQEQRPPPRHAANGGARYEETREVTPERRTSGPSEEVQCMRAHYR